MELVNSIPFEYFEEMQDFADKFPAFKNGYFSYPFTLEINDEINSFILQLFPNYWMESADISIFDDNNEPVLSNLPFNTSKGVNFFQSLFSNYKLIYNKSLLQFEIWKIN